MQGRPNEAQKKPENRRGEAQKPPNIEKSNNKTQREARGQGRKNNKKKHSFQKDMCRKRFLTPEIVRFRVLGFGFFSGFKV